MINNKKIVSRLLGASALCVLGMTAVQSQVVVGSQDMSITVSQGVDDTPTALTFTSDLYAGLDRDYISQQVEVTDINVEVPITVAGGSYNINGGTFTSDPGTVVVGDIVSVLVRSSASYEDTRTGTLTVGSVTSDYVVTTAAYDMCSEPGVTVGTACSDGMLYAGVADGRKIFIEGSTTTGMTWNASATGNPTHGANFDSGLYNAHYIGLAGVESREAANHCAESSNPFGRQLYLPSTAEMQSIYANRASLSSALITSGTGDQYWTSNEFINGDSNRAAEFDMGSGAIDPDEYMYQSRSVICVRYEEEEVYSDPCEGAVAEGTMCADGSIYAGQVSGYDIYSAYLTEPSTMQAKTSATATYGAFDPDGLRNFQIIQAAGLASHPASQACSARGEGWFVPSQQEFLELNNNITGALTTVLDSNQIPNSYFWTSTFSTSLAGRVVRNVYNGTTNTVTDANSSYAVLCAKYGDRPLPTDPCLGTPSVGDICGNGTIYAGTYAGNKYFVPSSGEEGLFSFKSANTVTPGAVSDDGLVNLAAFEADSGGTYPAAAACSARGSEWYLPSQAELSAIGASLSGAGVSSVILADDTDYYWTSNEFTDGDGDRAVQVFFNGGTVGNTTKNLTRRVLCVKNDAPRLLVDPCSENTIAPGSLCGDGSLFVGEVAGVKMFTTTSDQGAYKAKTASTATAGTTSASDGLVNTEAMILAGGHPAAAACQTNGPEWYLPSVNELSFMANNVHVEPTLSSTSYYWSSTQSSDVRDNDAVDLTGGAVQQRLKAGYTNPVRCVYNENGLPDRTPDAFTLSGIAADAWPGASVFSDPITVSGVTGSPVISVSGSGSPAFSVNGGAFLTSDAYVDSGDTVVLRITASSTPAASVTATLDIGGVTDSVTLTTRATPADQLPDAFTLASVLDAAPGAVITSETITLTGFDGAKLHTISSAVSVSINGSPFDGFTTPIVVETGDEVRFRITAGTVHNDRLEPMIEFVDFASGTTSLWDTTWTVETVDPLAANFYGMAFNWDYSSQPTGPIASQLYAKTSNTITIPAGQASYDVSLAYSRNATEKMLLGSPSIPEACRIRSGSTTCFGPSQINSMTVAPGDLMYVKLIPQRVESASSVPRKTSETVWCIGPYCLDFTHTANRHVDPRVPDAFSIPAITGAVAGSSVTSSAFTVDWAGNQSYSVGSAIPMSVSGGEYRVAGGTWMTAPGMLAPGLQVEVRMTAPAAGQTATASLTVGTVTEEFSVTSAP